LSDLIIVGTTESFRIPIYEAAAAAGKPVLAEKPIHLLEKRQSFLVQ